jgi:hypothetical protein
MSSLIGTDQLETFLVLGSTQSLSQLGSAMTSFALILWLYEKTGSALQTALLSICSYAPYVFMSIFAGAAVCIFFEQILKKYQFREP